MTRSVLARAPVLGLIGSLAVPVQALADGRTLKLSEAGRLPDAVGINSTWVIVAAILVMFMQAGFAFLEIGFVRAKNAGSVVAKILTNFSIAGLCYWAVGFAVAFGTDGLHGLIGTQGFFLDGFNAGADFPLIDLPKGSVTPEALWFFQFVFCAVSLAIVWGTTLERIKFGVYIIYAIVFAGFIYPIGSHWVFGGGWLQANLGMQDFAGSTAVHLIGATGALAALLLLGARKGKYDAEGRPRPIPGHSMPLFGLGVLILWLGWFGFNPGSTLNALDGRFPEILIITNLAAAAGVVAAAATSRLLQKTLDIGMIGNGAIAALVAITAPSGYVELWAAPVIGAVAGVIVVVGVLAIDKILDDPVGALSAHGLAGVWGTLACGLFSSPRLSSYNAFGVTNDQGEFIGGLFYSGSFAQLGAQALGVVVAFSFVFAASFATFWAIKRVIGLRVSEAEEDAGLDISEHGMYGYPEQFIPPEEYPGGVTGPATAKAPAPSPAPVSAMTAEQPSEA
jgi:Amt family ammonium transporter